MTARKKPRKRRPQSVTVDGEARLMHMGGYVLLERSSKASKALRVGLDLKPRKPVTVTITVRRVTK